jgi:ubiquinone biosynthesis protein
MQMADILIRNGFQIVVDRIFPREISLRHRILTVRAGHTVYERIRMAIEELGPTYIKFGQILSVHRELFPPEMIKELKKLTDQVTPLPFEVIKLVIEEHINIEEAFDGIEDKPIAAASLSQVHRARLKSGREIALKVRRPGIPELIKVDLEILESIAIRINDSFPELVVYNIPGLIDEFSEQIKRELDFEKDGDNCEYLSKAMSVYPDIRFPEIIWEYTSTNILAMEYIEGVRIDAVNKIKEMGVDPAKIADIGFKAYMRQIFIDGFFHGDPHPGNLLVTSEGELVFLDFGLVGIIRPKRKEAYVNLLISILYADVNLLEKALEGLGTVIDDKYKEHFKDDMYYNLVEGKASIHSEVASSTVIESLSETLRESHTRVPKEMMLILKILSMIGETGTLLYPAFDFDSSVEPLIPLIMENQFVGEEDIRVRYFLARDAIDNLANMPQNLNTMFKKLSKSEGFKIVAEDIERLSDIVDDATYRILLGLIGSSFVISLSLVVHVTGTVQSDFLDFILFGYFLFLLSGTYVFYRLVRRGPPEKRHRHPSHD